MSEYEVTVYRTVQQATVITVDSDRPLTDTERNLVIWIGTILMFRLNTMKHK